MEVKVTSENFKSEVLASDVPVLVDFWAPWCAPCRMLSPIIEQIAKEKEGALKVGKVNVDEEGDLASEYGVVSIPYLALFKEGKPVKDAVGYMPREDVLSFLSS